MDESDGVGGEELVEVLLDRLDQLLVDQSIMFGYHSRSETRMTGSFRMTPRSLRRKRSGRTLSGSSSALAAVLELDKTLVGTDGAAIESASSSPSSINPLSSTMQSEYQPVLETQLECISSRVQEMERHQSQSMELLRCIASQLGGSGSDKGASVKVRSSNLSNVDTTPPVDSSSAAQSKAERKRLQRRSSLGPAVHHISSAYATTSTSPRSAIVAATRLADELWQTSQSRRKTQRHTRSSPDLSVGRGPQELASKRSLNREIPGKY